MKIGYSRVIEASDGNLWITKPNAQQWGSVYSITTTGALLQTIAFGDKTNGSAPHFLMQASRGLLYGAAYGGGAYGYGTVFSINAGLPPR